MNKINGTITFATIPTSNPTTPGAPSGLTMDALSVPGMLLFNIGAPVVIPKGTAYQIIRSDVSTNAAVGTVVFDGNSTRATVNAPSSLSYYYARAYANSYFSPYYPNTVGISAASARVTLGSTATSSYSVGDKEVISASSYTPSADGTLNLSATVFGRASFDKDSGTYFSLICAPTSYFTTAPFLLPLSVTSVAAAGGYQGGYGFFITNSGNQSVSLDGAFSVRAGVAYTFGLEGFHSAGTQTIYSTDLKARFSS